jgi:hypothetical protein
VKLSKEKSTLNSSKKKHYNSINLLHFRNGKKKKQGEKT